MKTLTWILACSALALPASAQTVWRCGPDGRIFSDRPCASGMAWELDARLPAQAAAEAKAVSERERQALQALATERRIRESSAPKGGPGGIRLPGAAVPAEKAPKPGTPRRPAPAI